MANSIRVAHLASYPMHYQAPLYRELASRPEIELTVYFYSDVSLAGYYDRQFGRVVRWDASSIAGYKSCFLPSARKTGIHARYGHAPNWDVLGEVLAEGYDAVWAHGYAHLNVWLLASLSRRRRLGLLIRDDQTLLHPRPWYKLAAKEITLRALFARAWGLYTGEENRRYLRHYGMPETHLFPARHCVDNAFFRGRAEELRPQREELRSGFGIRTDGPVILYVGKLISKKAPLVLIEAFARLRRKRSCSLLLVGEGSLLPVARKLVAAQAIPDVHFAGFRNQSELPAAYAAADIFCLPSVMHETWGLVVNEAMNFGLPIVVTDKVGSGADLVRPGWNGLVVPSGDVQRLAQALDNLAGDDQLRRSFGGHSRDLVAEYSVERCADGIVEACTAVVTR